MKAKKECTARHFLDQLDPMCSPRFAGKPVTGGTGFSLSAAPSARQSHHKKARVAARRVKSNAIDLEDSVRRFQHSMAQTAMHM